MPKTKVVSVEDVVAENANLRELLERSNAIIENVLAHQGKHMTPADRNGREAHLEEVYAALK